MKDANSYLEKMFPDLLPDGVEYKTLEQCIMQNAECKIITPTLKIKRNDYKKSGMTPIISQEEEFISGYCDFEDKNIPNDNYICFGDHSEHIKFVDFAFVQGADGLKILTSDESKIKTKYLYYALCNFYEIHGKYQRHFKYLEETKIPLPPLAVQEEIVRILDKFTSLTAELTAELTARRAQYEYYRDALLTCPPTGGTPPFTYGYKGASDRHSELLPVGRQVDSESVKQTLKLVQGDLNVQYDKGQSVCEYKKLGEICQQVENIKWKNTNSEYQYIDLTSVDRETHSITETATINSSNAPSRAQQIVKENDVLFGTTRPMLKRTAFITKEFNNQICSTGFCVLRADKNFVNPRYIYHQISSSRFYQYVDSHQQGASYPAISDSDVKRFEFPLPPLPVQERIVSVLDNFDAICADLKIGLPAEIEARKKQYEYYRDLLLTFAERGDTILTADSRQQTADSRQQTADSRQQMR